MATRQYHRFQSKQTDGEHSNEVRADGRGDRLAKVEAGPYHAGMGSRRPRRGSFLLRPHRDRHIEAGDWWRLRIWWLIDFIMAVAGARKDKEGRPIKTW